MAAPTISTTATLFAPGTRITVLGTRIPAWPALALGILAVVVAALIYRRTARALRGKAAADVLTIVAAAMASSVAATGMWHFFSRTMHLPVWVQALLFAFMEISVLASALRARANVARGGGAGADGLAVWVLTSVSGFISATDAASPQEALVRLGAPLVAAWLWERSMVPERHAQRAAAAQAGQRVESAFTQLKRTVRERTLARLGVTSPDRTALEYRQDRALEDVVGLTKRIVLLSGTPHGPLSAPLRMARLRRLNRRADAAMLASGAPQDKGRQRMIVDQLAAVLNRAQLGTLAYPSPWAAHVAALEAQSSAQSELPVPAPGMVTAAQLPWIIAVAISLAQRTDASPATGRAGVPETAERARPVPAQALPVVAEEPRGGTGPGTGTITSSGTDPGSEGLGTDTRPGTGTQNAEGRAQTRPGTGTAAVGLGPGTATRPGTDPGAAPAGPQAGADTGTGTESRAGSGTGTRADLGLAAGSAEAVAGSGIGTATETAGTGTDAETGAESGAEPSTGTTDHGEAPGTSTDAEDRATGTESDGESRTGTEPAPEPIAARRGGGRSYTDAELLVLATEATRRLGDPPMTVEQVRETLHVGKNTALKVRRLVLGGAESPDAQPAPAAGTGTDFDDSGTGTAGHLTGPADSGPGTSTGPAAGTDPETAPGTGPADSGSGTGTAAGTSPDTEKGDVEPSSGTGRSGMSAPRQTMVSAGPLRLTGATA